MISSTRSSAGYFSLLAGGRGRALDVVALAQREATHLRGGHVDVVAAGEVAGRAEEPVALVAEVEQALDLDRFAAELSLTPARPPPSGTAAARRPDGHRGHAPGDGDGGSRCGCPRRTKRVRRRGRRRGAFRCRSRSASAAGGLLLAGLGRRRRRRQPRSAGRDSGRPRARRRPWRSRLPPRQAPRCCCPRPVSSDAFFERTARFGLAAVDRSRPSAMPLAPLPPPPGPPGGGRQDRVDQVGLAQPGDALHAHRASDRVQLLAVLAVEHRPFELLLGGHHLLLGIDGPAGLDTLPGARSDDASGDSRTRLRNRTRHHGGRSGFGRDPPRKGVGARTRRCGGGHRGVILGDRPTSVATRAARAGSRPGRAALTGPEADASAASRCA